MKRRQLPAGGADMAHKKHQDHTALPMDTVTSVIGLPQVMPEALLPQPDLHYHEAGKETVARNHRVEQNIKVQEAARRDSNHSTAGLASNHPKGSGRKG
jgi:hypothetical protein